MSSSAYGNAFIQVETDYEYVKGLIEDRAARFLMDFANIDGPLKAQMQRIGQALEDSAKDFLEQQGIERDSNLAKGIHAIVREHNIELRSSAYKLPLSARGSGEPAIKRSHRHASRVRADGTLVGFNRYPWTRWGGLKSSNNMISPQGVDLSGATGGIHSLQAYDIRRYNKTQHIEYYGGHVEYGHRTRNGGGIGFVQARPHLRPALRTVADASTGWLSTTMAYMLQGLGTQFDSYKDIHGNVITGLHFGSALNTEYNKAGDKKQSRFPELHSTISRMDAAGLRRAYSIRKDDSMLSVKDRYWNRSLRDNINFGKNINYGKYGYAESIRANARARQQFSGSIPYKHAPISSEVIQRNHHFSYQNKIPWHRRISSKERSRVTRTRRMIERRRKSPHYREYRKGLMKRARSMRSKKAANNNKKKTNKSNKNNKKSKKGKKNKKKKKTVRNIKREDNLTYGNKKRGIEPNPGGADPYRPTRPSDFMLTAKPTKENTKGMSKEEVEYWVQSYKDEKNRAGDLSREHNEKYEFYKKLAEQEKLLGR